MKEAHCLELAYIRLKFLRLLPHFIQTVTFKEIVENILDFLHGLICVAEMIVNTVLGRMQWQRTYRPTVQRSVEPTYCSAFS